MEVIQHSRCFNNGDHCGDGGNVIFVPCTQQPSANQIINFSFLCRKVRAARIRSGWNDCMVITHLGIVNVTPAQWTFTSPGREMLAILRLQLPNNRWKRSNHILRQMAAVGSRITNQLVLFIQCLSHIQSLLRGKPEQAVGVALQLR